MKKIFLVIKAEIEKQQKHDYHSAFVYLSLLIWPILGFLEVYYTYKPFSLTGYMGISESKELLAFLGTGFMSYTCFWSMVQNAWSMANQERKGGTLEITFLSPANRLAMMYGRALTKSGMDYMHMSESELYDAALKNTKSFMKPRMIRMRAFGMCAPMDNEAYCVMGNNSAKNCAALIADPEYLQEIAEMIGTDYYIVPLGIEGFVVVPEAYCDVDMQKDALKGTNEASQKDKLFLSNDLYFYGSETGELSVVQ